MYIKKYFHTSQTLSVIILSILRNKKGNTHVHVPFSAQLKNFLSRHQTLLMMRSVMPSATTQSYSRDLKHPVLVMHGMTVRRLRSAEHIWAAATYIYHVVVPARHCTSRRITFYCFDLPFILSVNTIRMVMACHCFRTLCPPYRNFLRVYNNRTSEKQCKYST